MKIEITGDDVRKGRAKSPSSCAIARALKRTFRGFVSVTGDDEDGIRVGNTYYPCSQKAQNFIQKFDDADRNERARLAAKLDEKPLIITL